MMAKLENVEKVTMTIDDGRIFDLTAGMDKLLAYVAEHKCEPGTKRTIDCPFCGKKSKMTYTFSAYNGHLRANCAACHTGIME